MLFRSRIILTMLSGGEAVAANDIIEEANDEGVSLVTLKRAKSELNVDTFQERQSMVLADSG